jgi:hypothetical protein
MRKTTENMPCVTGCGTGTNWGGFFFHPIPVFLGLRPTKIVILNHDSESWCRRTCRVCPVPNSRGCIILYRGVMPLRLLALFRNGAQGLSNVLLPVCFHQPGKLYAPICNEMLSESVHCTFASTSGNPTKTGADAGKAHMMPAAGRVAG